MPSVSQPFADLIILGKKTIELRKWNTNYGRYIHTTQDKKRRCQKVKD